MDDARSPPGGVPTSGGDAYCYADFARALAWLVRWVARLVCAMASLAIAIASLPTSIAALTDAITMLPTRSLVSLSRSLH